MTAGDRGETIAKAIRGLGTERWRLARQTEVDSNRIEAAYDATRTALLALPGDPWLLTPAVAAIFNRSETITWNRLQEFKSDRRYKIGRDYRTVVERVPRRDPINIPSGSTATKESILAARVKSAGLTNQRWQYRRNAVIEFWETRERKSPAAPRRKTIIKSPTQQLAEELSRLRDDFEHLQKLVHARLSFLTKDGKVFDNAGLPQASSSEIKAFLAGGGTVEFMTLGEAMQSRQWLGNGYREAWADMWKGLLLQAVTRTDQMALQTLPVRETTRGAGPKRRARA